MKGKGCPTFGPLGPWLVTPDEVGDVQNLAMWLDVNGKRMQTGSTKTMIFDCAQIVSYISHFMMLEPGDVITTGTPPGVGLGMKPPQFLKAGDVVTLGIEKLGEQRQRIVAYADQRRMRIDTSGVAAGSVTGPSPWRFARGGQPAQHQLDVLHGGARRALAEIVEPRHQHRVRGRSCARNTRNSSRSVPLSASGSMRSIRWPSTVGRTRTWPAVAVAVDSAASRSSR